MYFMWIGATFYSGHFPSRSPGQSWSDFFAHLWTLCYEHAFPHLKAWTIYWTFLIFEGACYLYMPGVYGKGKRLPSLGGKQLEYYCSAVWSWYTTIILAVLLHVSGVFPLYTIIDEFGSIMSVAIISGFLVSFVAYFSALARGAEHRMTGSPVYDFFMGAELNPRLFTWLDFKMFFEVRIPWYILFLTTLGACARQYETYGYVSGEAWFLLMAHFLYANACSKGEELIITSWFVESFSNKERWPLKLTRHFCKTGTCILKSGASCSSSGTSQACLYHTATVPCTSPTTTRQNITGTLIS